MADRNLVDSTNHLQNFGKRLGLSLEIRRRDQPAKRTFEKPVMFT